MTTDEMVRALFALGKKNPMVNHQQNQLIRDGALLIQKLSEEVAQLRERVYTLEERLSIMSENDYAADPEWPPIDEGDDPGYGPDENLPDELG